MAKGIVLGGKLYCRMNPSKTSTSYGRFSTGTVISVTSYNGGWYQTTWINGNTGYVMKDYVAVLGDTVKVTGSNVNVRNGAGGNYSSLYQLSSPATATVQDLATGWVKIKPSTNTAGWMSASYLTKTSSGSSGGGSVYPGVTGSGHNSTVTAADIRGNTGKYWKKDTSTRHPQIAVLQQRLLSYYDTHLKFSDYGPLASDGVYGEDTYQYVCLYQAYSGHELDADGKVGYNTLTCLENDTGGQIN